MDRHLAPSPQARSDRRNSRQHQAHSHWGSGQTLPWPSAKTPSNSSIFLTYYLNPSTKLNFYELIIQCQMMSSKQKARAAENKCKWEYTRSFGSWCLVKWGVSSPSITIRPVGKGKDLCTGHLMQWNWIWHLLNCKSEAVTALDQRLPSKIVVFNLNYLHKP